MGGVTIEQSLNAVIREAFRGLFDGELPDGVEVRFLPAGDERFGDYQCNAAMLLGRRAGRVPRELAAEAVARAEFPGWVERVEIAGPGFINVRLSAGGLAEHLAGMESDARHGIPQVGEGRTVVMDYSSPNVAKPMHIGHIRSTVIGNALDRMYRSLGYRVIADNHIGDWGTQFGLLIMGYRHFLDRQALERSPVEELERIYVKSYERFRSDEEWKRRARLELVKLQRGDEENMALWRRFVDLSMTEFERIYRRLGVEFDLVRGESYYRGELEEIVAELQRRGLARESEGAQVVFLDEEKLPPCIVRKRDGGFNYATTDLATIRSRLQEFAPERIVYVTDERQQLHFRQIFAIARRLGWDCGLVHVWFGLMRLPEGTFSTREGNVIKLELLLDEAERRALEVVRSASPGMDGRQQREVARAVGIGAVKYADLSQNPQSMVTFTWEKALALNGNSAPYLQYACARVASVLDKYRERFPGREPADYPFLIADGVERRLAARLVRFGDVVVRAAHAYRPNLLADYLYDVAQVYSSYYQQVPFLKAEEGLRESRVRLSAITADVLRNGLNMLGIETPERI